MNNIEFKHLITNATYSTKYEPIVNVQTDDVYAYEALSKFNLNNRVMSTEDIFRKLHHNNELFYTLEKRNKELQIKHFDSDKKLFVNFDADIFVTNEQKAYWEKFLLEHQKRVVVEITENGNDDEASAKIIREFASWLHKKELMSALDDFGQDGSMFSFHIMNRCQYIKLDRSFIKQIKFNMNYIPFLKGLLQTIRMNNQKSIIEGVETYADYDFVKTLDCDYMQGHYFNDLIIER